MLPQLIDTHCHIHESSYPLAIDEVMARALEAGVTKLVCVGTNVQSSREAIEFAHANDHAVATVGVHPHDTKDGIEGLAEMARDTQVVAIGEVGLDYFYTHSPRDAQIHALEQQLQIAQDRALPVVFHVREAFDDFWAVFENFSNLKGGVLHSFTGCAVDLERGLSYGLFIGVNGISTFTKDARQKDMFMAIPLERLLLETDAPFLTPEPFRGKVNEPSMVREVARYHALARGVSYETLARRTTANAMQLFAVA